MTADNTSVKPEDDPVVRRVIHLTDGTVVAVEPEPDAWAQQDALTKRYTKTYEHLADGFHRPDLGVVADGLRRCVFVHGKRHGVSTVRQYVDVLLQACAFVEEANPEWAEWPRRNTDALATSPTEGSDHA